MGKKKEVDQTLRGIDTVRLTSRLVAVVIILVFLYLVISMFSRLDEWQLRELTGVLLQFFGVPLFGIAVVWAVVKLIS